MKKFLNTICAITLLIFAINSCKNPTSSETPTEPNPAPTPSEETMPSIVSFEVDIEEIFFSKSCVLSWETNDATKVVITNDLGEDFGEVKKSGSFVVTPMPEKNTTVKVKFTLTASNNVGEISEDCKVRVKAVAILILPEDPEPRYSDGIWWGYRGKIENVGNKKLSWMSGKLWITMFDSKGKQLSRDRFYLPQNTNGIAPGKIQSWQVSYPWKEAWQSKVDVSRTKFELRYPNWEEFQ